ncbi:hypothetical protein E2R51_04435 [Jeotgalibacillus sp. S-D1]|uniref:hypothetical protein n=1 Tax=Jeotgalibacillus sp. S-D1 TaxID=2552189 RepID=UPI0010593E2A|nr:hypothetical protein [Jeotgalibacillus sp. S-D1]TDL34975.1 hypothetical protein E2R51_04435 [Jeotgalibacillus sp. S-D1]
MMDAELFWFALIMFIITFAILVLVHFSFEKRLAPIIRPYLTIILGVACGLLVIGILGVNSSRHIYAMIIAGILISFFASWFSKNIIKAPTL